LITAAIIMLLAAFAMAQVKDEKPESAKTEQRELRQGEARGTVVFSDGAAISGVVHATGFGPLKIFDTSKKKFKYIQLEHIVVLRVEVTKSEMVKDWRFKEESKRDKVYSGKEYPRKDYEVYITLANGEKFRGRCTAVLYVESKDKKTRFQLKHYDRGTTEEVLDDLVHVREIKFEKQNSGSADNRIYGTVEPIGELEDVMAVQQRYKMFVKGQVDKETGKYVVKDLLPGFYDLVLVTRDSVFLATGLKGEDFSEDSLSDRDKADLAKRVWEIKDFFEEKKVLHVAGNKKRAKAIVKTVRKKKTSAEKKGDLPLVFFHIEYWVMHKTGERWFVDWRIQLVREKGEQETKKDTKTVVVRNELADKKIENTATQLKVDFDVREAESGDEGDVIGR